MKTMRTAACIGLLLTAGLTLTAGETSVTKDDWPWAPNMVKVAKMKKKMKGVVLHLGDSLTYANQATRWAWSEKWNKNGGYTDEDRALIRWTNSEIQDQTPLNGWWLARIDAKDANGVLLGRSETAASGIQVDQFLAGGFSSLPSLTQILNTYYPQIVIICLGTNDVKNGRETAAIAADMAKFVDICLAEGVIPVLSTIPPMGGPNSKVIELNAAYAALAKKKMIPLLDLYGEIVTRRPDSTWMETIVGPDGVHLTHDLADGPATEENLKNCGYLLKCWLSVQKLKEVKAKVIDKAFPPTP
jgi:lysophospholipase L1-like esterase